MACASCFNGGVEIGEGRLDDDTGEGGYALLACSKAVAKADILPKRCVDSLTRVLIITHSTSDEIDGTLLLIGGGGSVLCW